MDRKVGWSFTKGQHVSEIQVTTFSERGGGGVGGVVMPNVLGPIFMAQKYIQSINLYMCH